MIKNLNKVTLNNNKFKIFNYKKKPIKIKNKYCNISKKKLLLNNKPLLIENSILNKPSTQTKNTTFLFKYSLAFFYIFITRALFFILIKNLSTQDLISQLSTNNFIEFSNSFFIKNLINLNINSLGILPCINASIVMQVLISQTNYFNDLLQNRGLKGKKTFEYWNRILILILSLFISYYYTSYLWPYIEDLSSNWYAESLITMTCGTYIDLLIADKITNLKLGSGLSIILLYNLLSNVNLTKYFSINMTTDLDYYSKIIVLFLFIFFSLLLIAIQDTEKNISIVYDKININESKKISLKTERKDKQFYADLKSLPLKINPAGILSLFLIYFLNQFNLSGTTTNSINENSITSALYFSTYLLASTALVTLFNYIFSVQKIKLNELTEKLKSQNAFISGVRSGLQTKKTINLTILSSSIIGSLSLVLAYQSILYTENYFGFKLTQGFSGNIIFILTSISIDLTKRIFSETSILKYNKFRF